MRLGLWRDERGQEKGSPTEAGHGRGAPDKETTATGKTADRLQIRLPEGMRDKLVEAANGRSLNDEIIQRLTQSLERDEMQKLSDRLKAQGDRLAKFEGDIAAMVEQLRLRDD